MHIEVKPTVSNRDLLMLMKNGEFFPVFRKLNKNVLSKLINAKKREQKS